MELLILQKAIVKIVQPVGLIWVVLLTITIRAWCKREVGTARLLTCLWLSCSLAANPIVGDVLVGTLENRFASIRPLQMEPLDTIVVLGGGTKSTERGDPALTDSGDRIGLAARMYHVGKVQRIVVSGKQIDSLARESRKEKNEREHEFLPVDPANAGSSQARPAFSVPSAIDDPAVQAARLLTQLGVPVDAISMVGGRNTAEEMQDLKKVLLGEGTTGSRSGVPMGKAFNEHGPRFPQKVGLITSAWHLPRTLRAARKAGLILEPVPADFASTSLNRSILDLIPDHNALRNTARTIKEYLGMAVGR